MQQRGNATAVPHVAEAELFVSNVGRVWCQLAAWRHRRVKVPACLTYQCALEYKRGHGRAKWYEHAANLLVRNSDGQALASVFEEERGRRAATTDCAICAVAP